MWCSTVLVTGCSKRLSMVQICWEQSVERHFSDPTPVENLSNWSHYTKQSSKILFLPLNRINLNFWSKITQNPPNSVNFGHFSGNSQWRMRKKYYFVPHRFKLNFEVWHELLKLFWTSYEFFQPLFISLRAMLKNLTRGKFSKYWYFYTHKSVFF